MKKNNYSSLALIYFFIRSAFTGISFLAISTISKQDAWISIILSIFIGSIIIYIYYLVANYKSNLSLLEKIDYLFPKSNIIIKSLLCLHVLFTIIYNFLNLTNLVQSQFLNKTPMIVISITFLVPIFYLVCQNKKVISRVALLLFYVSIIFYIINIILLTNNINLYNLSPIFINNPLKGIIPIISYNITPLYILLIYDNNDIKKYLFKGYLIGMISILIYAIYIIGILGINMVDILQYPEFQVLKFILKDNLSFKVENIFIITWIMDIYIYIVVSIKFINLSYNIKNNLFIPLLILCVNIVITKNITFLSELIAYYFPIMLLIYVVSLILFIYIKSRTKK